MTIARHADAVHARAAARCRSSIPTLAGRIVIRDPAQTPAGTGAAAGDKYSYRELDDYTDLDRAHA